mmetsp:Transcript_72469/g.212628  ORF Transcript_72469/g.212628 Transcript_72469/m.212628 type:complete len:253 (+) Transcript_72469:93-851(+)
MAAYADLYSRIRAWMPRRRKPRTAHFTPVFVEEDQAVAVQMRETTTSTLGVYMPRLPLGCQAHPHVSDSGLRAASIQAFSPGGASTTEASSRSNRSELQRERLTWNTDTHGSNNSLWQHARCSSNTDSIQPRSRSDMTELIRTPTSSMATTPIRTSASEWSGSRTASRPLVKDASDASAVRAWSSRSAAHQPPASSARASSAVSITRTLGRPKQPSQRWRNPRRISIDELFEEASRGLQADMAADRLPRTGG